MKLSIRLPDDLHADIVAIAKEQGSSLNYIIEQAVKYYRDRQYMGEKASVISEDILSIIKANNGLLLQQINNKSNRVLSEVAIQCAMQNLILVNELEVDGNKIDIDNYRKKAVEFLRTNNRVLRLDELIE